MNILIAADSFKDTLDSIDICEAINLGCKKAIPSCNTIIFPITDGGEGTADIIKYHLAFKEISIETYDPLFRKIRSSYLLSPDQKVAFVELAKASGLGLLQNHERNPMQTSTYGTGLMIKDALDHGVKKIILSIGGSATNDGGMGIATALGYTFMDKNGILLKGIGQDLQKIDRIYISNENASLIKSAIIEVMCDVKNPLFGPNGAAFIYGKQKGADDEMIVHLDQGLQHLAVISGGADVADVSGAGAAGGAGFGLVHFLSASLVSGINKIMEMTKFEKHVQDSDIIITGEGRLDEQTTYGKLISGITTVARQHGKPVIALCGSVECSQQTINNLGLTAVFSIQQNLTTLEEALKNTAINLEKTSYQVMSVIRMK